MCRKVAKIWPIFKLPNVFVQQIHVAGIITDNAPSSPTVANTAAFIKSKKQQSFSRQLAAELS